MKNIFRKITGRPADSFDQVNVMTTRKLPIPNFEGTDKFVQFTAKRTKEGIWQIDYKTNVKSVTAGFQTVQEAYPAAILKHLGSVPSKPALQTYNFDNAFLILKDLEESLLKYSGVVPGEEPDRHYMAAYRLLPRQFQEGLDDLFLARTETKGSIVPEKTVLKPQTATKDQQPKPPKPN